MQLAESMASSTEPAWLRRSLDTNRVTSQEKKPRYPKPGPSPPQPDNSYFKPVVVDLDPFPSEETDIHQSDEVIDLTAATPHQQDPSHVGPNRSSQSEVDMSPLQNIRVSVLNQSNSSITAETSRVSIEIESFSGNFNLQLEDTNDIQDDAETEEEEQKLLSQLQMIGSFDIHKSLSESLHRQSVSSCQSLDEDEPILPTRKKRAAVIYDSDEDEEEQQLKSPLKDSLQVLGASTPKSAPFGSPPHQSRRSIGGNVSVVSRRSLIQSIIEDFDSQDVQEEEEGGKGEEEEEQDEEGGDFLNHSDPQSEEMNGESLDSEGEEEEEGEKGEEEEEQDEEEEEEDEEEEDLIDLTPDELQLEETNPEEAEWAESEEASSKSADGGSGERSDEDTEKCSSEPELASGEVMEQCTVESECYHSLVRRGKECYNQENLEEALSFFLRAIDIRSGDPDLQFMTIQLYRRLSQR